MPVSDEQRAFWSTKNPAAEYETVTFTHPEIGAVRLVANCYFSQTFSGEEFTPVAARVKKPQQGRDPVASITIEFPRAVVGDQFNQWVKSISAVGWFTPVEFHYRLFTELNRDTPQQEWRLWVTEEGIATNRQSVRITASDDNPMMLGVSTIYTVEEFPGLASV